MDAKEFLLKEYNLPHIDCYGIYKGSKGPLMIIPIIEIMEEYAEYKSDPRNELQCGDIVDIKVSERAWQPAIYLSKGRHGHIIVVKSGDDHKFYEGMPYETAECSSWEIIKK